MSKIAFGDCLKLLLSTLDISNSRLSKAINVDSSLVNRWIHGKRVPPYNSSYIENISEFLSKNVYNTIQEQQIDSIYSYVCTNEEVEDGVRGKIKKILLEAQGHSIECKKKQSKENNTSDNDQLSKARNNDSHNYMEHHNAFMDLSSEDKIVLGTDNVLATFYKLLEIAANQRSRNGDTVYLSYNNLAYKGNITYNDILKWRQTMLKVINNGWNVVLLLRLNSNTIRTIKFINCMTSLVQTGKLMPYFIKNYDSMAIGDELAVVPDIGALACFSDNSQSAINCGMYIKSKPAIRIYQRHFQGIIAKYALPLVNIFSNRTDYSHFLANSEDDIGNRFLYRYCFSVLTLPEHLYWKFLSRNNHSGDSKITSMEIYRKRLRAFLSNIQNYEYKDVYMESSIKELMKNHQFYLYSHEGIESVYMNTNDIIEYLENIIMLLKEYNNYKIAFLPKNYNNTENMESFCCVVKERSAVIFESSNQFTNIQEIFTSITEPTLVKSVYDHFIELWEHIPPANREKSEVISWLQYQVSILKHE